MDDDRPGLQNLLAEFRALQQKINVVTGGNQSASPGSYPNVSNRVLNRLSTLQGTTQPQPPAYCPPSYSNRGRVRGGRHARGGSQYRKQGRRYNMNVVVLDHLEGSPSSSQYNDNCEIGEASISLWSSGNQRECYQEILGTLKTFDGLAGYSGGFEFVRRQNRTKILKAVVSSSHTWDGKAINDFRGSGKLYVRLTSPSGIAPPPPPEFEFDEVVPMEHEGIQPSMRATTSASADCVSIPDDDEKSDEEDDESISGQASNGPSTDPYSELTLPQMLHRCDVVASEKQWDKFAFSNVAGTSCAVSVTAAILQHIPVLMNALTDDTSIELAIFDIMAARGSKDKRIVETAARILLGNIHMDFGVYADPNEVLNKTIGYLHSARQSLKDTVTREILGKWEQHFRCGDLEVKLPYSNTLEMFVLPPPGEMLQDLREMLREQIFGPRKCEKVPSQLQDGLPEGTIATKENTTELIVCDELPNVFVVGISRNNGSGSKDNTPVALPSIIPGEDLRYPERKGCHDNRCQQETYTLKAFVVHSEIRDHFSIAVKKDYSRDKWILYDSSKKIEFTLSKDVKKYLEGGNRHDSITCAIYALDEHIVSSPFMLEESKRSMILEKLEDESRISFASAGSDPNTFNVSGKMDDMMNCIDNKLATIQGMQDLKERLRNIARTLLIDRIRAKYHPVDTQPLNLVFLGNPGTGKTTVARIFADILHNVGLTHKNLLVEVQREDLVGEHVGSTEVKTTKKIKEAKGGVMFVDEAYQLNREGAKADFGYEAVNVIMRHLNQEQPTKKDRTVFILAGYPAEMKRFMAINKGLLRRFREPVTFRDYSPSDLASIMVKLLERQGFVVEEDATPWAEFFQEVDPGYISLFNGAICGRAVGYLKEAVCERVDFSSDCKSVLFTITMADQKKALDSLNRDSEFCRVRVPTRVSVSVQTEDQS